MKALIIAEKPNLAKNVIKAIQRREKFEKQNGYYESKNYIVSWAVGHLLQLKDIADYEGEKQKWQDIKLPYIPNKFEFKIKDNTKEQFKILKELINRNDVTEIINCGDPDREGEVIVRLILKEVNNKKPVYRLWLSDQEEVTILKSLDKKESDGKYDNLYDEGIARTLLDWILGINETIYLTNKAGTLLRAGRILVPVVKKIYDRDMEIKNFKPIKYYQAESDIDNIKLTVNNKLDKSLAEEQAKELNSKKTVVKNIVNKDIEKRPSKLFSLTSLQKYLNKQNKMSSDKVLKICQTLYENKYTTYPRTDGEYMTEDEKEKAKSILKALNDEKLEFKDKKTIFDSSKVEAHSAITPTTVIPKELSEDEKIVYEAICNRFKANFCKEKCILSETNIIIENGKYEFKLTGKSVKQEGFLFYEESNNEKMIPALKIGDEINTKFKAVEKETKAPKKMTEGDLLSYLEHPFKKENNEEIDEEVEIKEIGLGTPATRAGIISNAKKMNYIIDSKNILSIGELGIKLIETIEKLKIDLYAEKTIEFSKNLKKVNEGKMTIQDCIKNAEKEIREIIENGSNIDIEKYQYQTKEKESLGKCPRCGKNIYEGDKSFYCEGYKDEPKCNFVLWKNDKFFTDRGKKITKKLAKDFLKAGKVSVGGLKKKNGSGTYTALITLVDKEVNGKKYVNFDMSFN